MEAIFNSKLFRTSSRKIEITAAMKNPINTELVMQLKKYLDKEYLTPENVVKDYKEKQAKPEDENGQTDVVFDESPASNTSSPSFAPRSPSVPDMSNELGEEPTSETEETDETTEETVVEEESTDTTSEAVNESVQIKSMIGITTYTDAPQVDPDVIKGTLNNRADCTGVSRVSIKHNELWIYYNDSINLNNVMENVIQVIEMSGYFCLSFNRLARTDNAIVFEISDQEAKENID